MINLSQMIKALAMFDGHYDSVAMFADDVREILAFAGRLEDESFIVSTSPGIFHVDNLLISTRSCSRYHIIDRDKKSEYVLVVHHRGVVELFRGAMAAPDVFIGFPYPILAVQASEKLKQNLVDQTFALLKKPNYVLNCFLLEYINNKWEAYCPELNSSLVSWAKEHLW
jgi:hypothetical protein